MRMRLIALALCLVWSQGVPAVPVAGLYSAEVPVVDRSEENRELAYRDCLAAVLVKVTGDRTAAGSSEALDLLDLAPVLLQQYRYTAEDTLWAAFDGAAVERAVRAAGLPVWGRDRPEILTWLAVDWGSGSRGLITAAEETDLRRSIERVAESRGLPLVWPLFDSTDRAVMSFSDLWGGFTDKIDTASARYGTPAVLVGRASRGGGSRLSVRWTLEMGDLREEWRGGLSAGIHRVADRLGSRFAVRGLATGDSTAVAVTGLGSLEDYAKVSAYLEKLALVERVGISRVAGDTVVFELRLQGDPARLSRIIGLNNFLQPLAPDEVQGVALGVEQQYRYTP